MLASSARYNAVTEVRSFRKGSSMSNLTTAQVRMLIRSALAHGAKWHGEQSLYVHDAHQIAVHDFLNNFVGGVHVVGAGVVYVLSDACKDLNLEELENEVLSEGRSAVPC